VGLIKLKNFEIIKGKQKEPSEKLIAEKGFFRCKRDILWT